MARDSFNVLSLCSGAGMLDRAVSRAVPGARTVCYVEREAYAAAVLAARMEEGALDTALVWSDLTTFDGCPWRGLVDCVIAGLPCQPYSVAGRKLGHEDERAIWPIAFDIIKQVRPAVVFLENVPGQLQFFEPIGERLSGMGFQFTGGLFSAEEVRASHKRERFFVLAVATGSRWAQTWSRHLLNGRRKFEPGSGELDDAQGERLAGMRIQLRDDITQKGLRLEEPPES